MADNPNYVDTPDKLLELCGQLQNQPWLALDTEFLREKTYYPKFCLLQIAAGDVVACVDPLAIADLGPLLEILNNPAVVKVFHAGRQDLEIFYQLAGRLPGPVFDTQLAAPLLGLGEQISYAGLVSELLGVSLTKSHSRTDWSRRPLSPEQIRYAADDVIYLAKAYQLIVPKLEVLGRSKWLEEDFAELTNPEIYQSKPEVAWQKVGGVYQLKPKPLSVVQALAAWREQTARQQDMPRGWIIKDETLLDLARQQPTNAEQLSHVRGIDERVLKRHGITIVKLIQEAIAHPPQPVEQRHRGGKRTAEHEAVLDLLMAVVRLRAAQNTLNPSVLASRKDLEQLYDGLSESAVLHGWRKTMVGDELAGVLRGEKSLTIQAGQLSITAHA